MSGLWKSVLENAVFVVEILVIAAVLFLVAYGIERKIAKRKGKVFSTRTLAMSGMFSAIAVILHLFDFPLPFAPEFYKIDFSELPIMIGTFAFGPVAGIMMEFCKILLKLLIKGTTTAFVGDFANFIIGCSLILPASAVYEWKRSKKGAIGAVITGSLFMTIFGTLFNALYLLPTFAKLYGIPLDSLIGMGKAINPAIDNIYTFVCFAVAPLNLVKSGAVSLVTILIYKPLSPFMKAAKGVGQMGKVRREEI